MKNFIFLAIVLTILTTPVSASTGCGVDEDTGLCKDGECRLENGGIGVCTTGAEGVCQCEGIEE